MLVEGALAGIGVRESVEDVARVLGRQVSTIVWRTFAQSDLEVMAEHAGVPVVNALTDEFHPCQLIADLLTVREHKGELAGLTVAFVGDAACNMGNSWLLAGATAGMHVRVAAPEGYAPGEAMFERAAAIAATTGGSATGCPTRSRPSPAPTSSSPTPGSRWARRTRSRPRGRLRAVLPDRPSCSRTPSPTRSCCTACRPTAARRSTPRSSTARRASSGTRPRTAGTPRRRS